MFSKSLLFAALATLAPAALLAADPAAPAARMHGHGGMLERLDANQDGVITRDEAASAPRLAERFDQLDADHDGMVTQDEMRAAAEARRQEMKAQAEARFREADTNSDGLLSKDEATSGMPRLARHFDQLDTSQDGQLSPEELAAARHHAGRDRPGRARPGDTTQR